MRLSSHSNKWFTCTAGAKVAIDNGFYKYILLCPKNIAKYCNTIGTTICDRIYNKETGHPCYGSNCNG